MLHQRKPEPAPSIAAKLAETLSEGTWRSRARPSQLPPEGDWNGWVVCAGRGFGKSWVASNFANEMAEKVGRIALIAPTDSDIRDTLIEGESGILRTAPSWFRPEYFPSKGQLEWPNGSVAQCFSSREPDRLRGPQFHIAVLDEFAAMQNVQNVWDMLSFGLRLGKNPQFLRFLAKPLDSQIVVVPRGHSPTFPVQIQVRQSVNGSGNWRILLQCNDTVRRREPLRAFVGRGPNKTSAAIIGGPSLSIPGKLHIEMASANDTAASAIPWTSERTIRPSPFRGMVISRSGSCATRTVPTQAPLPPSAVVAGPSTNAHV